VSPGFAGWLCAGPIGASAAGHAPGVSRNGSLRIRYWHVLDCTHKKAPGAAGAFSQNSNASSVRRDDRATPVEAVNQRGADGLNQRLEADGKAV
jgi:hypothetical protein